MAEKLNKNSTLDDGVVDEVSGGLNLNGANIVGGHSEESKLRSFKAPKNTKGGVKNAKVWKGSKYAKNVKNLKEVKEVKVTKTDKLPI